MSPKWVGSTRSTYGIEQIRGKLAGPLWPTRIDALWAVLIFFVLSLVVVAPLFGLWSTTYVGPTFGSSQIWQMRQVWLALLSGNLPPLTTDLLTYPGQGAVVFVGWPFMLVGFLFRIFMPTIAAVNCALVVFLTAGGFTMFLLAWRCSGSRWASLLAGALFGFSTYAIASVTNGHVYSMFVLWLPLLVLAYDHFLRHMGLRSGAIFGLVVILSTSESPYRLVEATPFLTALTVHFLTSREFSAKGRFGRVGVAALVCLLGLAGPLSYFRLQVDSQDASLYAPMHQGTITCEPPPHPTFKYPEDAGLIAEGWLDPVSLWRPGFLYDDSVHNDLHNAHHVQYLGLLIPLVILAFIYLDVSRRRLLLWVAILATAMAIGPAVHWGGAAVCIGERPLPGPMAFVSLIPATLPMGGFYRFYLSLLAAVVLMIALSWRLIVRPFSVRMKPWVTALAGLILLLDVAFLSPLRFPVPTVEWTPPAAVKTLAAQPGRDGVLIVPDIFNWYLVSGEDRLCGYIWQFHTRKPLQFLIPDSCADTSLRSEADSVGAVHYTVEPARAACLGELRSRGLKWVLFIGPNGTRPGQVDRAKGFLGEWFGAPVGPPSEDGSMLFQVP